jgi:acyl-CoA synthetase (AMP-forming)/AMP-acid ligase II
VAEAVIPGDMFKDWIAERPNFEYRTLAHLPTAHIAGIQGYLVNPFYMGGPVYWMPRFSWPEFLAYNKKYRITFFFTVPPIYLLIAKSPDVTDQFATLEVAISGAAPLGKDLQHAASAKLGKDCFISQTWGLSETTGSATVMPYGMNDDTGSVSPLMPNMLARLVDDDGKDVEVGKPGEVLVQGPVVCKGYHKNEAANKESFTGDWFHTGDIAEFRNGLFYIVDRKKELIKYKGLQVAPAELEALLLSHPNILDAAVIGVDTDDGTNEVPRAYVVADPKKISEAAIKEFVKSNVASHKQLRGGVIFMKEIPKSPSGKILRKDLRVLAKKEKGAKL